MAPSDRPRPVAAILASLALLALGCSGSRGDSLGESLGSERDSAETPDGRDAEAPDSTDVADASSAAEDDGEPDAGNRPPVDTAPNGDAGPSGGPDGGTEDPPTELDTFTSALGDEADFAALLAAGSAPFTDADLDAPRALAFAVQEAGSEPDFPSGVAPGGRESYLLLRWGFVAGFTPPASLTWTRYEGHISVSHGELELVAAFRWDGASEPSAPRPMPDVAVPTADSRLVRFSSHVGSGVDAVMVRITRPQLAPAVVSLRVQSSVRHYAFESFLGTGSSSGGWNLAVGGASLRTQLARRIPTCYAVTAEVAGSVTYADARAGTVDTIAGTITRPSGVTTPFTLSAGAEYFYPYGALTGNADGTSIAAFFGRDWTFGGYDRQGAVVGQLGEPAPLQAPELLLGNYYRGVLSRGRLVQQVPCDTPGASDVTPFELI